MKRAFSFDEANELIEELRPKVVKLQAYYRQAMERHQTMERLKAVGYRDDGLLIMEYDFAREKEAWQKVVDRANHLIVEINATGAQLKDVRHGLVDFPAVVDGERVFYCWKVDEEEIAYYHRVEAGFAGRQPVARGDSDAE